MFPKNLVKLKKELKEELYRILEFWHNETWDRENDGFIGKIDGSGMKYYEAPKGIIQNTRVLWTFSAVYNLNKDIKYAASAHRAYEYIANNFKDEEFGGVFWELDFQGNPINTKKQVYAQAFAIFALSEYYIAFQKEEAKNFAIELFCLLEKFTFDGQYNGYLEAYDRNWKLLEDLRLSESDANEKKSMNTHLHVLEAYSSLFLIWPDEFLKQQLKNLIRIHLDKILDRKTFHLGLFFNERWDQRSFEYSFGHDIEASWLLCRTADIVRDDKLAGEVKSIAVKIAEVTLNEGIDDDGGLMQEGTHDNLTNTDKHWWPQAESIVGFLNAYQISGEETFLNAASNVWEFIKQSLLDKEGGEWWWRVNREGIPSMQEDKAGFWKCPYHNGRACMEVINRF